MTGPLPHSKPAASGNFDDVYAGNAAFTSNFRLGDLLPRARKELAIVTCMDSRIAPLEVLGLEPGDAKILRNAGARVTDDVLRTLVVATYLLGVTRVFLMPHTGCRMAESTEAELHTLIDERSGIDTSGVVFGAVTDQQLTLVNDLERLRASWLLSNELDVAGAIYDVSNGALGPLIR